MQPKKPIEPLAPLAPLAPAKPMMPTQPTQPAGGSFGMPPVSTYDQVYRSYDETKENLQTNEEAVANDIFDPFFNRDVRAKYKGDYVPDWLQAGAELVKRQFQPYLEGDVWGGVMNNLELVGESLDKVTGLPGRALVNKLQTGEGFWETTIEGFTTNNGISGKDIREQAGIDFNNPVGNWLADMVTEIALDPTTWIGIGAATKIGKGSSALTNLNKALDVTQSVAGRAVSTLTPVGAAGMVVKGTDYITNPLKLLTAKPAAVETFKDVLEAQKPKVEVQTVEAVEPTVQELKDSTNKIVNAVEILREKSDHAEMEYLAKQQRVLDELFISATETRIDNTLDELENPAYRVLAQDDMTKSVRAGLDMKEFYELISQNLLDKDASNVDLIENVIEKLERFEAADVETRKPLRVLERWATPMKEQLVRARQELKDYDVLRNWLEEEGKYDFLYTAEAFVEEVEENGVQGTWDTMNYVWRKTVAPVLEEMKKNHHLLVQYPELQTIREFFTGTSDNTEEVREAIEKAATILDRKVVHPIDTKKISRLFERRQTKPVVEELTPNVKSTLSEPNHYGEELKQVALKADREINQKLGQVMNPVYQNEFKQLLDKKAEMLRQFNLQDVSTYTDEMELLRGIEETIQDLRLALEKEVSSFDFMKLYDEYEKQVLEVLNYLEEGRYKETPLESKTGLIASILGGTPEIGLDQVKKQYLKQVSDEAEYGANRYLASKDNLVKAPGNFYRLDEEGRFIDENYAWLKFREERIDKPIAQAKKMLERQDLIERGYGVAARKEGPHQIYQDVTIDKDFYQAQIKHLEEELSPRLTKEYYQQHLKQLEENKVKTFVDKTTGDWSLDSLIETSTGFEQYLAQLRKTYRETIDDYDKHYTHLQLNKQRTQTELANSIETNDALDTLFQGYTKVGSRLHHYFQAFQDVPSVKALMDSMDAMTLYQKFLKRIQGQLELKGLDYDVENQILDALYNYFDKLKKNPTQNTNLLRQIEKQKERIKAHYQRAETKNSTHLKEKVIPQEEEVLRRLEADLKVTAKPVERPEILNEFSELIDAYLAEVAEKGLEIAKVPDGPFSSQLKHVSDDLKNRYPLMEAAIDHEQDFTALTEAEQLAYEQTKVNTIATLKESKGELLKTLEDAKVATREILKQYKDENRRLSQMYISNQDAWEFSKGFQQGYPNIAEYLKAENPRVMIKNGSVLKEEIKLRTLAKQLLPDSQVARNQWVDKMLTQVRTSGVDEETVWSIFFDRKANHRLDVRYGEQGRQLEKILYEKLFPGQSFKGDEWDLKLKSAIRRAALIKNPQVMSEVVLETLTPKRVMKNWTPQHFEDYTRQIYEQFRTREHTEALDYLVSQATQDAYQFLKRRPQQAAKLYQDLMPLGRDNLLKELQSIPFLQVTHPSFTDWTQVQEMFKHNPALRVVAVVESPKHPGGYTVKSFKVRTAFDYEQAKRLNGFLLDYESAEHLRSLFKRDPLQHHPALRFWQNWFVQTYKVQALINFGFHFTNMVDLLLKNVSQGSLLQAPGNVMNVLKGQLDMLNYQQRLRHLPIKDLSEKDRQLVEEIHLFKQSLASGTELTNEALREGRGKLEKLRQYALYDNPLSKGNQWVGNLLEEGGRLALFRQMQKEGLSLSSSFKTVIDTHFDFSNKPEAIQWAELIFPFTTFAVRNFIFWADKLATEPKLVEYLYESLQYNYAEHGYDSDEGIDNNYIISQMGRGNLVFENKILQNGNSLLDAMRFVGNPVESMSQRIHPLLKAGVQSWTKEMADWDQLNEEHPMIPDFLTQDPRWMSAVPFNSQYQDLKKYEKESYQDLGAWGLISTPFFKPYDRVSDGYRRYPDYPDYPKGQRYYPRYYTSRSYHRYRQPHSYNFYKSLYTSTGKSRLAMRLTPTNYRNLEGRILNDRYQMKY